MTFQLGDLINSSLYLTPITPKKKADLLKFKFLEQNKNLQKELKTHQALKNNVFLKLQNKKI
jgi:hypothetical protein